MRSFRCLRNGAAQCFIVVLCGLGILAGHGAGATGPVETQSRAVDLDQPTVFAIPAQNLTDALDQFSRTSSLQVLYDSGLAVGEHSTAVNGVMPIKTALELLLRGTGLLIHYTRHHDVILTSVRTDAGIASVAPSAGDSVMTLNTLFVYPPAGAGGSPALHTTPYRLYGTIVRTKIQEILQRNVAANGGNYSVKLSVWVSPSGTLLRYVLLQSSGDAARDRNISAVLRNVDFNQPPPSDLPQPIEFRVSVRGP
jgi:TonB family protein